METRYMTVKDIKEAEKCGRDQAYHIAAQLPHERRGKNIFVFKEDYDKYYQEKRQRALEKIQKICQFDSLVRKGANTKWMN